MREKDIKRCFEVILKSFGGKLSMHEDLAVLAAARIVQEVVIDLKRLSEAIEVIAESKSVKRAHPVHTGQAPCAIVTTTRYRSEGRE